MFDIINLFMVFVMLFDLYGVADQSAENRNILWNASFETGIGNGPWGIGTQAGPNTPGLWYPEGWHGQHSARLLDRIVSKRYDLGTTPGTWRLSFMARSLKKSGKIKIRLTNQNHHKQKKKNQYEATHQIGTKWALYSSDFKLVDALRPLFHLEFKGVKKADVLIDAVMLYRVDDPSEAPVPFQAAEDLETGVIVPEITHVFLDGDEKTCSIIVSNHSKTQSKTEVQYTLFDVREEIVRQEIITSVVPPEQSIQIPVSLENLPYNAYRIRVAIPGNAQAADGLIALLPETQMDYGTRWGCNASLESDSYQFSIRMMKKLGMGYVTSISTGQHLGRWSRVQRKPGQLALFPEIVKAVKDQGIWLNLYLGASRAPKWVYKSNGLQKDNPDPEIYSNLFADYVYSVVTSYAGDVLHFTIEDEVSGRPLFKGNDDLYVLIHQKAYAAAKKAAGERGAEIQVSTNESYAKRFNRYWDALEGEGIDFISTNSISRPGSIAGFLKSQQNRQSTVKEMWVPAVGRRCKGRPLAINASVKKPMDKSQKKKKKKGGRVFSSYYSWEVLKALWMSKPYGNPEDVFGPLIHPGFYELRAMSNTPYLSNSGYSGIEFDNSPNPGFQSVVCLRFLLKDRSPWREPGVVDQHGIPLPADTSLELFSFRNDTDAMLVVVPGDGEEIDRDVDLILPKTTGTVYDFFANPVIGNPEGKTIRYSVSEFPVYIKSSLERASSMMEHPDQIGVKPR